jgi:hypothetical protein
MRNATIPKPPSFAALVQQFFTEYLVVTFRRNGAGHFRRNDATGNEQLEGSNGDQGCLILPPFASSVLGDSTPGFSPR